MMHHDQQTRYARQISLPQMGVSGQKKLAESSVLLVGAGGLGAPLALYLATAGIGRIGVIDPDRVALSNLPRQVTYETADIGRLKVEALRDMLEERNAQVKLEMHPLRLDGSNAHTLMENYDIVADGSDNFETRLAVNAACHHAKKTLVSSAVMGFSGQISTYKSYLGVPHPCYQCLIGDAVPEDVACSVAGVLGAMAGMMACWQGTEIIKELLEIGESLSGSLLHYDALAIKVNHTQLRRDPMCKICVSS
jgi:molybdopterin/thiamine biosynthesis adenylyltransferase